MENVTEKEKKSLNQKLLEFQQNGLIAYGNYLKDQLDYASKSNIRSAYKKYIEDQIAMNLQKIVEIEVKLKGYEIMQIILLYIICRGINIGTKINLVMHRISAVFVFVLLISFGCQNSNSTGSSKSDHKKTLDSKETESTCLELSFIENLETSWKSSYKGSSLPLKGFVRIQSRSVENGQEIVFENRKTKSQLIISKFSYKNGEKMFTVDILLQPEKLICFEDQLKENDYTIDEDDYKHFHHRERYIKNGSDTSETKAIHIVKNKGLITYLHRI